MTHVNAPLTPLGRLRLASLIVVDGWSVRRAAERFQSKQGLGLAHFEGRTFAGLHYHTARVTAAHLFVTALGLTADPKAPWAA